MLIGEQPMAMIPSEEEKEVSIVSTSLCFRVEPLTERIILAANSLRRAKEKFIN